MECSATTDEDQMNERFGPAISGLLGTSSARHIWRLSFLSNFFIAPLYAELADEYGVSRHEVQILYCLTQYQDLLAQDISLITGQPKNSISRAVSQLLDKGYLRREIHRDDGRARTLKLTKSGRAIINEVMPAIYHRQDAMRAALTPKEQATFDKLISKIVFSIHNWVDSSSVSPDDHLD